MLNAKRHNIDAGTVHTPIVKFLVGGVQKGGTTAIHSMLSQHPQLFLPKQKELHFFDSEQHFLEKTSYDKYHRFFDSRLKHQICGEATPSYIYAPSVVKRVFRYNPNMKWIVVLRNPISRAYSQWNMQRMRGIEPLSFINALQVESERLRLLPKCERQKYAYIDRSCYAVQIQRLFSYFNPTQCLFMTSENMRSNPSVCLDKIATFLKLEKVDMEEKILHTGTYLNNIPPSAVNRLTDIFASDVVRTQQLTGLDLSSWEFGNLR